MCETVKDEALALIDNTRHMSQVAGTVEDEDSMETDSPRGPQKDQRDGVSDATLTNTHFDSKTLLKLFFLLFSGLCASAALSEGAVSHR